MISLSNKIREQIETPVLGHYDIIVCGGGVGGLAAAVSASRNGAKVLLIEKSLQLGGLATLGLINWYEPLCDGLGRHIMFGMPEELLSLAVRYGYDTLPENWRDNMDAEYTGKRRALCFAIH